MKKETICVHGEQNSENSFGAISVPIYQTASFSHPSLGESTGYDYSRLQNPTREELENIMTSLENGIDSMAFSTGMAAISALMELFEPGDHIIASDDLYGGTPRLFDNISKKNKIEIDYIDTSDLIGVKNLIKENTKALFIETPTNPMMQITDLKAISKIGKEQNLIVIVDNTFLSPYFQNPLSLGADIVVHSGTKYIGGHNDTLGGFLTTNSQELSDRLRFIFKTIGSCLGPMDSWLMIRGIKTLAIRMKKQEENAMKIAKWLKKSDKVKKVFYIGLPDHPQYEISKSQSRGFGAMISFEVDSYETVVNVLENIKIIKFAESLGGVESLMTFPKIQTHADVDEKILEAKGVNDRLLRLSVGIEDIDDLIKDLESALGGI
ncbi:MAG: PLP-dependent aspartate aminotransferase family protein [Andreesenia angusta]|nr:PLP-dependent aspartate aminotransferase family protein [Andreesenia angusta]